jgi:hypothetical protein
MVVENETMGEAMTMLIDYDFLPIWCKFCLKSFHQVKDYSNLASLKEKSMKVGEACRKPYSRGNKIFATQGKGARMVGEDIHKDGVDHHALKDPKIGSSKKQFSPIQEEGKQNGKDSNNFFMVISGKKKPRKDRPMPIWVLVNNMLTTSDTLHQSDDTISRKKTLKENVQDHAIMVNGVEKEYAIGKAPKMDSKGSGMGQVVTTKEGQQVEGKLSLDEREMI